MNSRDKKIIIFFIIFAVTYSSIIVYIDLIIPKPVQLSGVMQYERKFTVTKYVNADRNLLFNSLIKIEKFPLMFPQYITSVKILNKTHDVLVCNNCQSQITDIMPSGPTNRTTEYVEMTTAPVKTTFIARHVIFPDVNYHIIEILTGDAKRSIIEQAFDNEGNSLRIRTAFDLYIGGELLPFGVFQTADYQRFAIPIVDQEIRYAQEFNDSKTNRLVDDLYREVLHRPADPQGLDYFSSLIDEKKITPDDLRRTLLESDERKLLLDPGELKSESELSNQTKQTVNKIYNEVLYRNADIIGLEHFGTLLEDKKITTDDLRRILLESDEKRNLLEPNEKKTVDELSPDTKQKIDALYQEMFLHDADTKGLEYWGSLIEAKKMTYDELKQILRNSPEYVPRYNDTGYK
ncbi:MAG: hypothetical protein ACYDAJ_03245 [Nitrosotalea sp.]